MVKLLIADDNKDFCLLLVNYVIRYCSNIQVIGIVNDGREAIASIRETKPDILLLDIGMPYFSGIEIIKYIKNIKDYLPKVVFISGDTSKYISRLMDIGIEYVLIEKNALFERMLNIIMEIALEIESERKIGIIDDILRKMSFNNTNIGYKYINTSIYLANTEPELLINLEKKLYAKVAKIYGVTPLKVKWNIQKAINSTWRYSNEKTICEVLDIKDGRKPTAKYIIEILSAKIY